MTDNDDDDDDNDGHDDSADDDFDKANAVMITLMIRLLVTGVVKLPVIMTMKK